MNVVPFDMRPAVALMNATMAVTKKRAPDAFRNARLFRVKYCAVESARAMKKKKNCNHRVHVALIVTMTKIPNGIKKTAKKRPKNLKIKSGLVLKVSKVPKDG